MVAQVQNLEDLIASLLDCVSSYYNVEAIRNEVADSIKVIGINQPNTLLTACHHYLLQNTKLASSSKAFVLSAVARTVSDKVVVAKLDEQLVLLVINLAAQQMTLTKHESDEEWAESAREVLVTLARGDRFVTAVIDAVLQKFPPGLPTSPHRHIVLTLATIAQYNPFGLIGFLTDILSRTVPLLSHVKTDQLRCAWARAICSFCEAIRECETERPKEALEHEAGEDGYEEADFNLNDSHEVSNRSSYADQAEALYEVVFQWMYSKDARTRAEAAECVGELCLMVRPQKVTDDLKKLVNTITGLYRKSQNENHLITVAVCRLLEAGCADDSCPMDAYLEDVLNALFPNACLDPDDVTVSLNPHAIKNHSEAFRCFDVAASRFADRIVYYLLHKMQHVVDMQKLGAINVLRHLLNSAGQYMEDKRSLVMMGLRKLLAAENVATIRVKRAMVQLCVALADHSYVDAEGGDHVISFLVRNLVPPTEQDLQAKRVEIDVAGSNQLRTQCAQALHTIASTCEASTKLLWPYLLEFICTERYTPVMADLAKCLRTIITRERAEGREMDYETGFDNARVAGRLPVMTRLFVCLCNAPLNGLLFRRARECLGLLMSICSWFHNSLVDVIDKHAERVDHLLDEVCNASASTEHSPVVELRGRRIARWHDACLDLLSQCVSAVQDGEWRMELAAAFGKQMDLYKEMPEEKAFLMRCLGTCLAKITLKPFIVEHVMLMFKSTLHSVASERQGCARGVGATASAHTDLVLIELENVSKWEHTKKSYSLFGFIKDAMPMRQYTDAEMIFLRASLLLSYGQVVAACPSDTLSQRLQQTIIPFLRNYFANTKQEVVVREAMLETMRLIAISVTPARLGADYRFDVRNELISYIKDYIQSETPEMLSSSLRLLAAKATAALVRLEPPLSDTDVKDLAVILTQSTLPMCREKSGLKTLAYDLFDYASSSLSSLTHGSSTNMAFTQMQGKGPRKMEEDESATLMEATVGQFGVALEALLATNPNVTTTTILLKLLQPWYGRSADHERSRSMDATVLVLRVYYQRADDILLGHASEFVPLSSLLARLSPRLVDSLAHVRLQAFSAIQWALRLSHVHKGHPRDSDSASSNLMTSSFPEELLSVEGKLDGQIAKQIIKKISEVIESRLPQSQMQTYLSALLEMLTDRQSHVSSAAAQLLTYSLGSRGATLASESETLVSALLSKLVEVHSCVQTYTDLLAALVAFAPHQQQTVCDVLLAQPLPYTVQISDAWECISRDRGLFAHHLDYLLDLLSTSLLQPFDVIDTGGGNAVKVVHQEPCQYVAALTEMLKNGEPEWTLNERVPSLLAVLFTMLCTVSDTQFPVVHKETKHGSKHVLIITPELRRAAERPAGMPVTAIKTLLHRRVFRLRCLDVIEDMNQARGWTESLDRELFVTALSVLVRSLVRCRPDWVGALAGCLVPQPESDSEPRRLAAVLVASTLTNNCPDAAGEFNERLLVDCVRLLQNHLSDPSLRIRKLCVRGLGNLADCGNERASGRFAAMAVEAAMAGLDDLGDRQDTVAMESIIALSKLVSRTDDGQLRQILPQVLLKMRPCFEKESPALRAASFSLFGELGTRVGTNNDEFVAHLHTNLVTVLLHLNDDDDEVKKQCGICLVRVHSVLNVDLLSTVVTEAELEPPTSSSYPQIIRDFALVLAVSFPDRVNQYALTCSNYYKSVSAAIRANAALLTGALLGGLTPQLRATVSKDLIFSNLVLLLKDPENPMVRVAAARAIASLHSFS